MIKIEDFKKYKVLVIGDIILDQYVFGEVNRISPEAPVPILNISNTQNILGGAANVALNCKAFGAEVNIISVIGNDLNSSILINLLIDANIGCEDVFKSSQRKTTTKTRFLSSNHQLLRIDDENIFDISYVEQNQILNFAKKNIQYNKPDVIIFQDYDKGVLNESIINSIISLAKNNNIFICVDPKHKNFFFYNNVDIFKPNLKEAINSLGISNTNINHESLELVNSLLRNKLTLNNLIITLSEYGVYYNDGNISDIIPAHKREISDVSGAGDTVISTLALFFIHTRNIKFATKVANLAGGLVCETVGTSVINSQKLFDLIYKKRHE